jgi:hypothetical protein
VGQAVEVTCSNGISLKPLRNLGFTTIRSYVRNLIPKRLILGIGAHLDRLYIDIRELTPPEVFMKVCVDKFPELHSSLKDIQTGFKYG